MFEFLTKDRKVSMEVPPKLLCLHTGLFKMIVGVLTTCHIQYTWDRSI